MIEACSSFTSIKTCLESRALQGIENLPCPVRAGQGKVIKIVAGQVAGYERHNLSTCNKFHINHYRDLL
jgi:hypothetical protein